MKTVKRDLSATMGFTNNPSMAIRIPSHKKLDDAVDITKLILVEFKKRGSHCSETEHTMLSITAWRWRRRRRASTESRMRTRH